MGEHNASQRNIFIAFILNLSFSILEMFGGIFTNSIAIISDAVHDMGDALSILIAWWMEKKANKRPNQVYTYGYARYSVLGALILITILCVGSISIIYKSVPRLINPEVVNYDWMIIFGIFGILINGAAVYVTSKGKGVNEKAVNFHILEDVLGWVAVLISSIVMKTYNFPILDPILSIVIAIYILCHVFKELKEVMGIFLEKAPNGINIDKLKEEIIESSELIEDVHHIHAWTMDGENIYVTMHVVVDDDASAKDIIKLKQEIKNITKEKDIEHITIEIEYENEGCENECCD